MISASPLKLPSLLLALSWLWLPCLAQTELTFLGTPGTLSPAFSPAVSAYTLALPSPTTEMAVFPIAMDPGAKVEVRFKGGALNRVNRTQVLAGGRTHSLAVNANGAVVAWGSNEDGESTVPVSAQSGVVSVATQVSDDGDDYSLALKADGSVLGWGSGFISSLYPLPPEVASEVVAISASGTHSLALKRDGTIVSWGAPYRSFGEIMPPPAGPFVAICAGQNHALALRANGSVVAWGLGDKFSATIIPAGATSGVVAIGTGGLGWSGYGNSYALKQDATMLSWGDNPSFFPSGLNNASLVGFAMGRYSSLGLKNNGSVVAWGSGDQSYGIPAAASSGVAALAGSHDHALALKTDGTLFAWGSNSDGQATVPEGFAGIPLPLAPPASPLFPLTTGGQLLEVIVTSRDGSTSRTYSINVTREAPGELSVFRTASALPENELTDNTGTTSLGSIGLGQDVITETFTLRNSGTAPLSQLGVSLGTAGQPARFSVGSLSATSLAPGQSLTFTVTFSPASVGTDTAQLLICSDDTDESVFEVNLSATTGLSPIPALTSLGVSGPGLSPAFSPATLAYTLSDSGSLALWPRLADPMTRIDARVNGSAFQAVNPVHTIASSAYLNYVLRSNGTMAVWGWNGGGPPPQIPVETSLKLVSITVSEGSVFGLTRTGRVIGWGMSGNLLSVPVAATSGIVAVSTGSGVTLALSANGSILCWDQSGPRTLPSSFASSDFVGVAASYPNSFALRSNGSVVSWDVSTGVEANVPVVGLSGVKAITASSGFCLALKENGAVIALGNINGQPLVIPPGLDSGVVAVSCNSEHVIALKSDGTVVDWNAQSGSPYSPENASGLVAISAGVTHGIGLKADGTLVGWGGNFANVSTIPSGLTGIPQANGSAAAVLPLVPGTNTVELRLTARDGLTTQTYSLNVTQTPSASATWRQTHFGTMDNSGSAADLSDPDGDGISNLMEFATGSLPLSHNHLTTLATSPESGRLTFTYARSKAAVADGIGFRVEWSDTLPGTSWSPEILSETAVDQGAHDQVTVTLNQGDGSQRFVRLVVSRP